MIKTQWNDSITEGIALPSIYLVGVALCVSISTVVSAITAFVILQRQKSGLYGDPASLAGLGTLIAESNLVQKFRSLHSFETQEGINKSLGDLRLGLLYTGTSNQITSPHPEPPDVLWQRDSNEAHPWWLRGWTYIGLNVITFVPSLLLVIAVKQQTYQDISVQDPLKLDGDAVIIKMCTAVLALANAALYANWHLYIGMLQPYYHLARHSQGRLMGSSGALRMDFSGSAISNLVRPGQSFDVWLMAVCALLTQLAVIVRPAAAQNRAFILALENPTLSYRFKGLTIPAGVRPLGIMSIVFDIAYLVFTLYALVLVLNCKRKPFLPRKPDTLSSRILYLCHGTELLEDLKGMSTLSKKARNTRLKQTRDRYALAWVEDGAKTCSYIGIDTLKNIERHFQYPKADPNEDADDRKCLSPESYERLHPSDEGKTRREAGWPDNAQ